MYNCMYNWKNESLEGVPFSFIVGTFNSFAAWCQQYRNIYYKICYELIIYEVDIKNKKEILKAKGSNLVDDEEDDFGDDEDETDERNVDVHDEYDNNIEFSSNENNINYESDYRPSASVAQLVKIWVLNIWFSPLGGAWESPKRIRNPFKDHASTLNPT